MCTGSRIEPLGLVLSAGHPARRALMACPGAPAGQQGGRIHFGRFLLSFATLDLVKLCLHIISGKCSGNKLPLAELHACIPAAFLSNAKRTDWQSVHLFCL